MFFRLAFRRKSLRSIQTQVDHWLQRPVQLNKWHLFTVPVGTLWGLYAAHHTLDQDDSPGSRAMMYGSCAMCGFACGVLVVPLVLAIPFYGLGWATAPRKKK